jgi:hypothetical protein
MPHALNFLQAFAITNDSLEVPIFSCRDLVTNLQQNFSVNWHQFLPVLGAKLVLIYPPARKLDILKINSTCMRDKEELILQKR